MSDMLRKKFFDGSYPFRPVTDSPFFGEDGFVGYFPDITVSVPAEAPDIEAPTDESTEEAAIVAFQWTAVANANRYELELATAGTFTGEEVIFSSKVAALTLNSPELEDDDYFVRVRAIGPSGKSDWSEVVEFEVAIPVEP